MKDFLKQNKRLLPLMIILALTLYVSSVLMPQIRRISSLKGEIAEAGSKYRLYSAYSGILAGLDDNKANLKAKMQIIRQEFPPDMNHSDIYMLLSILSEQSGIVITNINISDAREISQAGKAVNQAQIIITDTAMQDFSRELGIIPATGQQLPPGIKNAGITGSIADGKGYVITVKAEALGSSAQYRDFFARIASQPLQINVKQFSGTAGSEGKLKSVFTLEFYGIKDRGAIYEGLYKGAVWGAPAVPVPGKDVFAAAGVQAQTGTVPVAIQQALPVSVQNYDFTMRVVPYGYNMAPSTVSLSARNLAETGKSGLITGDSRETEKAELYLAETGGKFYCRYLTGTEAFPDEAPENMAEFIPAGGNITIGIDSVERVYLEDSSGVDLKIYNNTSKLLVAEIMNDDKDKPRVLIEKASGAISVINK